VSAPPQPPRALRLDLPHGISLAALAVGPEPARARRRVLLLHGFPEGAFAWTEVLQGIAARDPSVFAVAPSLRGYAGSSAPSEVSAYRPRALVADLAAAIAALGEAPDLLVAHDWGGALAWNLAAQHPALMKRLMIINAPHPAVFLRELRHNPLQQQASAYMNRLCRPDAADRLARDDFARLWAFFEPAPWMTPARRAVYRQAWQAGLEGALNFYRASPLRPAVPGDAASAAALQAVQLPDEAVTLRVATTVIWGERDAALLPGLLQGLERWVPALELRRLPAASHWVVHEQPQVVLDSILEAIAGPGRA